MMRNAAKSAAWLTFGAVIFIGHCVDSKFGIGLRVGDHADFQILLELGPPQVSDPISNDIYFDLKKDAALKSARKAKLEKYKLMQKNKSNLKKMRLNMKQPKEKEYHHKKTSEMNEGSQWLAKWKREFVRRFSDTIAPTVGLPIKTVSRRVNRMKVVESTSNHTKDNNDLIILKRLFENVPR